MSKNKQVYIPVVLGTGREKRLSETVAKVVFDIVRSMDGVKTTFVDVRDYATDVTTRVKDAETKTGKKWRNLVSRADGLLIVSPEYNHGYPGELKMLLDQLYKEYWGMTMGIVGVSDGSLGGARMIEQLRQVAVALHMTPMGHDVRVTDIADVMEMKGVEKVLRDRYEDRVKSLVEEMVGRSSTQ